MPTPGRFHRSLFCYDRFAESLHANAGGTTYAMAAANVGIAFRFIAPGTRDVKSVYINWSTITAAGTITLSIEDIDAATGLVNTAGADLYDANATKTFTPTAGWQNVAFDTTPTTGMTAGNMYAVVMHTASGGTAHTLRAYVNSSPAQSYPQVAMTDADVTTRSFAEVTNSIPICTLVFDDDSEEALGMCGAATVTSNNIYGTLGVSTKLVIPTSCTFTVAGIQAFFTKVGTPAGDARLRIFTSADATVSGSTITLDKESINTSLKQIHALFATPVTLTAGTYRIVVDSASSANSSNCWRLSSAGFRASGLVPSGFCLSTCPDVGTPSWTDTATDLIPLGLILDDITASGGGGMLVHPGMSGGIRG